MTDTVKEIIENSKKIVFIIGMDVIPECGGQNPWAADNFHRTAKEYDVGPEALLSAGEYSSRKERFYRFYKEEILHNLPRPNSIFENIRELEKSGKLEACISMHIYGLEKMAKIKNLIELSGNLYNNHCPDCNEKYTVDYILKSKSVPLCKKCEKALRPDIRLLGERVDNDLLTKAAKSCTNADAIIVLGADLYSSKIQYITGHYDGTNLILFSKEEKYADKFADVCVYGNITENLALSMP